jgi:hypothetical protein
MPRYRRSVGQQLVFGDSALDGQAELGTSCVAPDRSGDERDGMTKAGQGLMSCLFVCL